MNGGIIDKAEHGVDKFSEEEYLEQLKLAESSAMLKGNGLLATENLDSELRANLNDDTITTERIGSSWYYNGYCIEENGNVEKYNKLLPKEYQQIEYIQSTGTQCIDTGIVPNLNIGISLSISDFERESWKTILGTVTAYQTNSRFRISTEEEKLYAFLGDEIKIEIPEFDDIRIDFNNPIGKLRFNEKEYNVTNTLFSSSNLPITLFAENNSPNGIRSFSSVKMKKIQVYSNNSVVRDYVPCYCTTIVKNSVGTRCDIGTKGLYDLVEGKFYTNQGTEEDFTAGPNV